MRAEYAKLLSSAPALPVSDPPVTNPLKMAVSHVEWDAPAFSLATESPGQAAIQIEEHAGHRPVGELEFTGRHEPGEGERVSCNDRP